MRFFPQVDAGVLSLDDAFAPYVDAVLSRGAVSGLDASSVLELWGGDARISAVTIGQLLKMTSGVPDYDTPALRSYQNSNPSSDVDGPAFALTHVNKSLSCDPSAATGLQNACPGVYSSTNYVLLGLVLLECSVPNATDWRSYDQSQVLTPALRKRLRRTSFSLGGGDLALDGGARLSARRHAPQRRRYQHLDARRLDLRQPRDDADRTRALRARALRATRRPALARAVRAKTG